MPLFDFVCEACEHVEEDVLLQSIDSTGKGLYYECPKCKSEMKKSEIQKGGSFHLKGNGWYVTDYK